MAKDVKLLICAREGKRKGEVIDQKPLDREWGRKECPPLFVRVRVNGVADDFDFRNVYESGQHMEAGKVVKDYSKKLWLPEATVDEIAAEGKQRVVKVVDFEDRSA